MGKVSHGCSENDYHLLFIHILQSQNVAVNPYLMSFFSNRCLHQQVYSLGKGIPSEKGRECLSES